MKLVRAGVACESPEVMCCMDLHDLDADVTESAGVKSDTKVEGLVKDLGTRKIYEPINLN